MQWQWIIGPAVGAVIGYITNDIAVRMLFRPHEEKTLFGRRVPFTPGLIPKERPRLARAIREVLDGELLNPEVMSAALLSDRMIGQVEAAVDGVMARLLDEKRTPRMLLAEHVPETSIDTFEAQARRTATIFLMEKLLQSGLEDTVAELAVAEARRRVSSSTAGIAGLFWDDKRSEAMRQSLSGTIREMIATHAPDMLDSTITTVLHDGLDTPVADLLGKYADRGDQVRAFLIAQYQNIIRTGLKGALRALDLGQIVEDRLNELNMRELERLIMQVMRKELHAIVWLGALLGAVMGLANAAIQLLIG